MTPPVPFSQLPMGGPPQTSPGAMIPSLNYTPLTQANAAGVPGIDPAAGAGADYGGPYPTSMGWLPLNMAGGGEVKLDDGGVPAMGDPVPMGGGDPWRTLTYAGLGIMGGNSPNALTNIGRGALQGLQAADRANQSAALNAWRKQQGDMALRREQNLERHQNETEQQAARRLADEAEYHRNQLKHQDDQTDIARSNLSLHRDEFNERNNQFWNGTMPWRQSNQDIALGNAITRRDQGQERIDQTGQRIDLSQQRLQNLQHYQQQSLDLRKQALDQTKDATDRRMIQTATNQVLNGARSIILAHPEIKWADAVKMAGQSQGNVQSNVEPPPSSLPERNAPQPAANPAAPAAPAGPPPSAIDYLRQNPALAPAFQQKYGVDPRQYLSPGS